MRTATLERNTSETQIQASLMLDAGDMRAIETGVGFFDHMLDLFGKHGFMNIALTCKGDTAVDAHHTVEDVGIVLGQAFLEALGDKSGARRYGHAVVPMDEAAVEALADISGRPFLVFDAELPIAKIGEFDIQLVEEFFRAFAMNARVTLHISLRYGKNLHHIAEAMFKAAGRALAQACEYDARVGDAVLSTKGTLE